MDIMTRAKFHFNQLMLTLMFGVWASESPLGPGEQLKRPGLIGLKPYALKVLYLKLSSSLQKKKIKTVT